MRSFQHPSRRRIGSSVHSQGPTVLAQGAVDSPALAQGGLDVTLMVHWSHFTLQPTMPILEYESLTPLPWGGPVCGTVHTPENLSGSSWAWALVKATSLLQVPRLPYSMFPASFQACRAEDLPTETTCTRMFFLGSASRKYNKRCFSLLKYISRGSISRKIYRK